MGRQQHVLPSWLAPCSRLREQTDLAVTGEILYNGRSFDQFVPERSASYISQVDLHYGEGTGGSVQAAGFD